MPIEFKDSIDVDGNIKASQAFIDSNDSAGTIGQILTSTGSVSQWSDAEPGASTLVQIACKNTSGGTITVGTPVYQTGTVGATSTIEVAPANALISAGNYPAIGLLKTTLVNNDIGFVVITGALTNIITSPIDGAVPTTGDTVYLKSGGGLTLTKPTGEGNAIQNMGLVGKVSAGTSGSITVSSIMRANDVPNLPTGRIWVGDGNTLVSDTVFVDEPNLRLGIGTTAPTQILDVRGKISVVDEESNVFVGWNSGLADLGDNQNVGVGIETLRNNTSGYDNTATGYQALRNNTTGPQNTANGANALRNNTTGVSNVANGFYALYDNTSGGANTATGSSAGQYNTSGYFNTAYGYQSLFNNTTGGNNTAIGGSSGSVNSSGFGNTTGSNSVFIGYDTRPLSSGETNQIVIGNSAIGIGSNSVVLGNDSITKTILRGNVTTDGSVQVGDNTDTAIASNVGAMRYRTDGSASYADMCMETSGGIYEWVNIVTNTF